MDISKIKIGSNPDKINAVIEIPYGSNVKYEIDKTSGAVVVDRVLYSAVFYPANYGFVAQKMAEILNLELSKIEEITTKNAEKLFKI